MHQEKETFEHHSNTLFREISQTYEILHGRDAGVIPDIPGWISPNAFVSFVAVTALPALCMLPFDYSYAIAFYDRLGTAARFHHVIEAITIREMFLWNRGTVFPVDIFI